jgi:hypothetical protein
VGVVEEMEMVEDMTEKQEHVGVVEEMMEMVGDMTEKMEHVGMVEEMVGDMTE